MPDNAAFNKLKAESLAAAQEETAAVLCENWDDIIKAYSDAIAAYEGESKFKYTIGMSVIIQPQDGDIRVNAKIAFSVKYGDETAGITISTHPQLPLEDGKRA